MPLVESIEDVGVGFSADKKESMRTAVKIAETSGSLGFRGFLHPHPRVTAVAKKTVTAAPLALSRNQAGEGIGGRRQA
ncbi:MAG TPA: hypothetical protein VGH29_14720 [Candidatus Binataceae bacterium]